MLREGKFCTQEWPPEGGLLLGSRSELLVRTGGADGRLRDRSRNRRAVADHAVVTRECENASVSRHYTAQRPTVVRSLAPTASAVAALVHLGIIAADSDHAFAVWIGVDAEDLH